MQDRVVRVLLGALALNALLLGFWATIAPRNYFDEFPGGGRAWVAPDGPYNQHLMRDYGALNVALGVVAVCAAVWLMRPLIVACGLAFITYAIPHLLYHLFHLDLYSTGDQIGIVVGLLVSPAVALAAIALARPRPPAVAPAADGPETVPI
jgi:hypothetical protein